MSVAKLRPGASTDYLQQSKTLELLSQAFSSLSKGDQEVLALYAASGGKRGWTEASPRGQTPNSLRVRLHRATKRLKSRLETNPNFLAANSPELLDAILMPNSLTQAISFAAIPRQTGSAEINDGCYIRVTIELREDEFSVEARNALFEFFAFDRISISRAEPKFVESRMR